MFQQPRKANQRNVFTNKFGVQNNTNFVKKQQFKRNTGTVVVNSNKEAQIARNLEHLNQVSRKKKIAQEYYYSGRSPIVKGSQKQNAKLSVQQRLGLPNNNNNNRNNFNRRTSAARQNTNKQTFVRKQNKVVVGGMRSDKILRIQNMQQKRARVQFRNAENGTYVKPIRKLTPPTYTVSIPNNRMHTKHHVSSDLNPQLQQEIKWIQNKNRSFVMPEFEPFAARSISNEERLPIVTTNKTLNERFSML